MDSDLTIKGFVIHRIIKEANSNMADSKLADHVLSLGGKEISFLSRYLMHIIKNLIQFSASSVLNEQSSKTCYVLFYRKRCQLT